MGRGAGTPGEALIERNRIARRRVPYPTEPTGGGAPAKLYAAAILLAASVAFAQDATPVFRANSELVLLDVQVLHNKTNTALGDLQAGDF